MSFQFWLGCGIGMTVLVLGCLFALALGNVASGADAHIEKAPPLVTVVDGGTVIGKAEVLSRKGRFATVRFEGGQVVSVDTEFVELIEGSEG